MPVLVAGDALDVDAALVSRRAVCPGPAAAEDDPPAVADRRLGEGEHARQAPPSEIMLWFVLPALVALPAPGGVEVRAARAEARGWCGSPLPVPWSAAAPLDDRTSRSPSRRRRSRGSSRRESCCCWPPRREVVEDADVALRRAQAAADARCRLPGAGKQQGRRAAERDRGKDDVLEFMVLSPARVTWA